MKKGQVTVVFDEEDLIKFNKLLKRTSWSKKKIITFALRELHEQFNEDWEKMVVKLMKKYPQAINKEDIK